MTNIVWCLVSYFATKVLLIYLKEDAMFFVHDFGAIHEQTIDKFTLIRINHWH